MDILTLYRIHEWDGGDRHVPTKYHFRDPVVASEAKGKHGHVSEVQIVICDTIEEMDKDSEINTIRKTLANLSHRDRETIGLPADLGEAVNHVWNQRQANKGAS